MSFWSIASRRRCAWSSAVSLNSHGALARLSAGWIEFYIGDPERAISHFTEAMRLDPLDPAIGVPLSGIAFGHRLAARVSEAVEVAERAVSASPTIVSVHCALVAARGLAELPAADAVAALLAVAPGFTLAQFQQQRRHQLDRPLGELVKEGLARAGVPPGRLPGQVVQLRPRGAA